MKKKTVKKWKNRNKMRKTKDNKFKKNNNRVLNRMENVRKD